MRKFIWLAFLASTGVFAHGENIIPATPALCNQVVSIMSGTTNIESGKLGVLADFEKAKFLLTHSKGFRKLVTQFLGRFPSAKVDPKWDAADLYLSLFLELKNNEIRGTAIQRLSEVAEIALELVPWQNARADPQRLGAVLNGFLGFLSNAPGGQKYIQEILALPAGSATSATASTAQVGVESQETFNLPKLRHREDALMTMPNGELRASNTWVYSLRQELPLSSFKKLFRFQIAFYSIFVEAQEASQSLTAMFQLMKKMNFKLSGSPEEDMEFFHTRERIRTRVISLYENIGSFLTNALTEFQKPETTRQEFVAIQNLTSGFVLPLVTMIGNKTGHPEFDDIVDRALKENPDFANIGVKFASVIHAKVVPN